MKTPDEIKKLLEYMSITNVGEKMEFLKRGNTIPYGYTVEEMCADALALIQQLEANVSEKEKVVSELSGKIGQLEEERDAAVADIRLAFTSYVGACKTCKHGENQADCIEPLRCGNCENEKCKCQSCDSYDSNWEWRGVQKEE